MRREKGIALITVLLILGILFLATIGLSTMASEDFRTVRSLEQATVTFYLADAGIEYSTFLLNHDWAIERNVDSTAHTGKDFLGTEFVLAPNLILSSYVSGSFFGTFEVVSLEPLTSAGFPTGSAGAVRYLRVKSIGRIRSGSGITTSTPAATIKASPIVSQRTVYSRISLPQPGGSAGTVNMQKYHWYEKYR